MAVYGKNPNGDAPLRFLRQGYKDSNLEMTESESVALPFGDSPMWFNKSIISNLGKNASAFCRKFF